MKKSNKKHSTFLLLFIFLLTAVLTISSSYTLSKFTQTKNTGEITIEIIGDEPVLYRDFVSVHNLRTENTTEIVFDSWSNQKANLGLTDEDWEKNTNFAQEAKNNPTSSDNLCKGIKVFEKENTAYVLAEGDHAVTFPVDSSGMFLNCSNLTSVKFNLIDTDRTTNMLNMFFGCSGLRELDLSEFNTSNVSTMEEMFSGCAALQQITLSKDFKFVGTDGYLPDAAEGNCWYVLSDEDMPITTAEIAANQTTVTAATTYVQKPELTL